MKLVLSLFLALALSACGTFQNPITRGNIDALNAAWGATLTVLNGYRDACERRIIPSDCRTKVEELKRIGKPVQMAVLRARDFAKNPQISATNLVIVAMDALNDFKVVMSQYGVR